MTAHCLVRKMVPRMVDYLVPMTDHCSVGKMVPRMVDYLVPMTAHCLVRKMVPRMFHHLVRMTAHCSVRKMVLRMVHYLVRAKHKTPLSIFIFRDGKLYHHIPYKNEQRAGKDPARAMAATPE